MNCLIGPNDHPVYHVTLSVSGLNDGLLQVVHVQDVLSVRSEGVMRAVKVRGS